MAIDFSVLKNIDFKNPETLIFLGIAFVVFLIVFFIFLFIIFEVVKVIKRFFVSLFSINKRVKPKSKKDGDDLKQSVQQAEPNSHRVISASNTGGGIISEKKQEVKKETNKEYEQEYKNKEQKEISEGLSRLKSEGATGQGSLASKMPSREEKSVEDDHKEIKIHTSKGFHKEESFSSTKGDVVEKDVLKNQEGVVNNKVKTELLDSSLTKNDKQYPKENSVSSNVIKGKAPEMQENKIEMQKEKNENKITEDLKNLKLDNKIPNNSISSKMPSRKEDGNNEIKVPVSKNFHVENKSVEDNLLQKPDFVENKYGVHSMHDNDVKITGVSEGYKDFKDSLVEEKNIPIPNQEINAEIPKNPQLSKESPIEAQPDFVENKYGVHSMHKNNTDSPITPNIEKETSFFKAPDFAENKYGVSSAHKDVKAKNTNGDDSIFQGKTEVSRLTLEHELKKDAKVWQASKQIGLNMSPVERAKLVKEVFSSALGRNISKNDLKVSIKKLSRKMLDAKDSTEHAKIRKEIKFFKKIGGIK